MSSNNDIIYKRADVFYLTGATEDEIKDEKAEKVYV